MDGVWYVRSPALVAIARRTSYLFVVAGSVVVIDDVEVDELAQVLHLTVVPIAASRLLTVCSSDTIETLIELGVLVHIGESPPAPSPTSTSSTTSSASTSRRCRRLVVGLSGSIAVTSALDHILPLAKGFADEVDVILTSNACRFVEPRVFGYHGLRTWTDLYEPNHGIAIPHKYLADADLILIAPASANTIHRLVTGACSDLLSLVAAFTKAPVVLAPSMNAQMWAHPPIVRNVAQLRRDGFWVIEPSLGFALSDPTQPTLGAMGFDVAGLLRGLDSVLTHHTS